MWHIPRPWACLQYSPRTSWKSLNLPLTSLKERQVLHLRCSVVVLQIDAVEMVLSWWFGWSHPVSLHVQSLFFNLVLLGQNLFPYSLGWCFALGCLASIRMCLSFYIYIFRGDLSPSLTPYCLVKLQSSALSTFLCLQRAAVQEAFVCFREQGCSLLAHCHHHTVWVGVSMGFDICLYFSDTTCGFFEPWFLSTHCWGHYPLRVSELAWPVSIVPLGSQDDINV